MTPLFPPLFVLEVVSKCCVVRHSLAIHLDNSEDKFNLYIMMMQKLFSLVQKKCCVEGADGLMMHELLLGGHLYLQLLKERMQIWLHFLKSLILKKVKTAASSTLTNSKLQEITEVHYHYILNMYLQSFVLF
jgi:DNA-directed RNA polymerase I subunit RPA2